MTAQGLRLIFAGTPDFAAHHLQALLDKGHNVVAVYTQPDRPSGRGKKLTPSPVKKLALEYGLTVMQPATLKHDDAQHSLRELDADLMIVVAYGLILPQAVLETPRHGCLNVHASLLPRWRGAAPIQRAIEAGDSHTGVCIMQMDAGLDTGAVLARSEIELQAGTNAAQLHQQLQTIGAEALLKVVDHLPDYQLQAQIQSEEGACYAHKIEKSEAQLDWSLSAVELARKTAAFNPFPVCWSILDGERLKIWAAHAESSAAEHATAGEIIDANDNGISVACGTGKLVINTLQFPGGKAMPVGELLKSRGPQLARGKRFEQPDHER